MTSSVERSYTCDELYDTYCGLRQTVDALGSPFSKDGPVARPTEDNPWVQYVLRTLISLLLTEIRQRVIK